LTSFRGQNTGASSFRGNMTRPQEPLTTGGSPGGRTTHSHTSWYFGSYYYAGSPYYYYPTYYPYYSGFGFGFSTGSFWLGFGYSWYSPFGFYTSRHIYFGSPSIAFLVGNAWHIQPYGYGWYGFNFGPRCHFYPWHHFKHRHRYRYRGLYFSVCRPYWYGYARWYDYRPYGYSYTSIVYDSLYDDGYRDGYNRGYYDGADDASAYRDDRRRDEIGSKPRPRQPDSSIDRARTNAAEEYRHEMTQGTESFQRGDFKGATRAFKEAVILSPESSDARYSLAVSAFAEGKYAFSAFALRRGIALDPQGSDIDLKAVFSDPVVFSGFTEDLQRELSDNPDDPDLLLVSGYVALRTEDVSRAAQLLDRAIKANPRDRAAEYLHREAMKALEEE
jgi:tetratricopeptide (TPR) repeat protein